MSDQSIPQLTVASTPLTGQELTVVVQNAVTKQAQVQNYLLPGGYTKVGTIVGIPTNPPPALNGFASTVYDTAGNNFYVYNTGSWRRISGGGSGSGTVTSVAGTGNVNGITLSGTVTTAGSLVLGGTLDLSSPPAIGGTAPAAASFTTLSISSAFSVSGSAGTTGQVLTSAGPGVAPTWAASAAGTVTSVSGAGTVNGLTLSGTVTSSGSLILGGTLSLTSPPPIGGTTPSTAAFTSLTTTAQVTHTNSDTYPVTVSGNGTGNNNKISFAVNNSTNVATISVSNTANNAALNIVTSGTTALTLLANNDLYGVPGFNAMTSGFVWIPSGTSATPGTPATTLPNNSPLFYDQTNKVLYIYNNSTSSWNTCQFT